MKINSLYIHAFGGLKNFSLDFGDGLTVIYGDNEMGKTTVMAFIKMMFYGSGRAGGQLSKNIRQKYTPWDAAQMAGSIDFEHSGKRYRLEKEFRTSNSTDKATLCDLDLGTRQAVASDIGLSFFGISMPAFERSVFIGQLGFPEKDTAAEGEINSKLSNLALTGEESISFDAVNARLHKAKLSLMSKSGKAGEYDKGVKLLGELKERIERSENLLGAVSGKKTQIAELQKEIELLSRKALALKEKISTEQDVRNAEKLAHLLELKKQLDVFNETLKLEDGSLIDEMYLRKLKFCISRVDAVTDKIAAKQGEIDLLCKSLEAGLNPPEDATTENALHLEQSINTLNKEKEGLEAKLTALETSLSELERRMPAAQRAKKKLNLPLLLIGLALILAAAVLFVAVPIAIGAVISGTAGLILSALSFILRPADQKPYLELQEKAAAVKSQIADLKLKNSSVLSDLSVNSARLEAITAALTSSAAMIEKQQQLLAESRTELAAFEQEKLAEEKILFEQFSKYRSAKSTEEIITALEEISQKAATQKELKQQLNFILNDLNGISYEEAEKKLASVNSGNLSLLEDFEALKGEYEAHLSLITDRKTAIATLNAEIKSALSGAENGEALKKQLAEITEKTASQKEFCEALDLASTVLAESFAEVRRSYGSVLEKKAGHLFEGITGGKYSSMSISKSLDINVSEAASFGSREIDYLSSGTADQAYLSLRLALAELMCNDSEKLPLFLDDALTQYDDGRTKTALQFLKEYSENTQIIMFTCHSYICEASKVLDIKVKKLGE